MHLFGWGKDEMRASDETPSMSRGPGTSLPGSTVFPAPHCHTLFLPLPSPPLPFSAALKSSPSSWQNAERNRSLPLSQPVLFLSPQAGAGGIWGPKRQGDKTPRPGHSPRSPVHSPWSLAALDFLVGGLSHSPSPLLPTIPGPSTDLLGASPSPTSSSDLLGFQESLGRGPACQDLLLLLPCRDS